MTAQRAAWSDAVPWGSPPTRRLDRLSSSGIQHSSRPSSCSSSSSCSLHSRMLVEPCPVSRLLSPSRADAHIVPPHANSLCMKRGTTVSCCGPHDLWPLAGCSSPPGWLAFRRTCCLSDHHAVATRSQRRRTLDQSALPHRSTGQNARQHITSADQEPH